MLYLYEEKNVHNNYKEITIIQALMPRTTAAKNI